MRTSLSALQWQRLRAYVHSLDDQAKRYLLHRCETWEKAVAKELSAIADGHKDPKTAAGGRNSPALDSSLVNQVAGWLKT